MSFLNLLWVDGVVALILALLVGWYQYTQGYTFWKTVMQAWIGFFGLGAVLIKLFA